jgi:hypothetical protein
MTQIEDRLRQELQDMAQRLSTADLRPLRVPSSRPVASRARKLAPLAAACAVLAIVVGLLGGGHLVTPGPNSRASHPADPKFIAVFGTNRTDSAQWIKLASLTTGSVRLLAHVGTANSLALAPDGKLVFVVAENGPVIRQISVATGKITVLGPGANPAVSLDSRQLAYATGRGFNKIAIRDLRTGRTRLINVEQLIGRHATLLNNPSAAWLADGNQVVMIPQPDAVAFGGQPFRHGGNPCGQQDSRRGVCLILVSTGGRQLRAREVFVQHVQVPIPPVIAGDAAHPHDLLMAVAGSESSVIEAIEFAGHRGVAHQVAQLSPATYPRAIAPLGDKVFYSGAFFTARKPIGCWVATIHAGRLVDRHRVHFPARFGFDEVAW